MTKNNSISMVVLHIADNLVLKLKVNLYRRLARPNSVTMKSFYSEVEYYNQNHQDQVVNIKLDYSYGLVLESPYSDPKVSVWIDWFGLYEITFLLSKVVKWFQSPEQAIYENINGHMKLTNYGNELVEHTAIYQIPFVFNPVVISDPLTNMASAGVVFSYTTNNVQVTINMPSILAWYSYMSRVDLAAAAQSLLSYIRPPQPGTNRIVLNNYSTTPAQTDRIDYGIHGIPGRQIGGKIQGNDELK